MVKTRAAAMRETTPADVLRGFSETPPTPTTTPASPAATPPVPATVDKHSLSGLTIEHDPHWSPTVQVLVGPKKVSFMVHTRVIVKINFFRICLDAGMQESQTGQIKLPDDEPEVFAQVVYFAYYGHLGHDLKKLWRDCRTTKHEEDTSAGSDKNSIQALKVYCLAQKLGFEELQNWCIDRILWSL